MRTPERMLAPRAALFLAVLALAAPVVHAAEPEAGNGLDWQHWKSGNDVANIASLQRGARNFMGYCSGCHSLKYVRYSRMAQDLRITEDQLSRDLMLAGSKPADYIVTSMPAADSEQWFGKTPPDLSLEARLRSPDWIYQFLKTFYADPSRPATGVNNLRLENAAMPHVLADLQGVQKARFHPMQVKDDSGSVMTVQEFAGFEPGDVAGRLTPEQYDEFVRDIVNFLDYAGEPAQVARRQMGVWVVLFLLAFTWLSWLLKKEYWKDIR